jgi:hypothetical protein
MQARIPFDASQASSAEELGGAPPLSANVIRDSTGAMRSRPGVSAWDLFPADHASNTSVTAILEFKDGLVFSTEDRKLWYWTPGIVKALSDSTEATKLNGTKRPIMIPCASKLVVACDGEMQTWPGSGLAARLTPDGSSPRATHVSEINRRLVCNPVSVSGTVQWSGQGDANHTNWTIGILDNEGGHLFASARPDKMLALFDTTNELYGFGAQTIQVFYPDATVIDDAIRSFAPSRTQNIGLAATYSIIPVDDIFALLDSRLRFITTDGRQYRDLSTSMIGSTISGLSKHDDCWGFRMRLGSWDCLVWIFPTVGKGFIYDLTASRWGEWRFADNNVNITSAYQYGSDVLVGLTDGSIGKLDPESCADLGEPIKCEMISGFQMHGTNNLKHSKMVLFRFRHVASGSVDARVRVWNRADTGRWNLLHVAAIDNTGDETPNFNIYSIGTYRQMQWKVEYIGSGAFSLIDCIEDYDVLGA